MDTTDPEIRFDAAGVCNHCTEALRRLEQSYFPDERGEARLAALIDTIRRSGKGKPYDCLIGISGGMDSSWLVYKTKDWGLRPLCLHVDAGWDSDVARENVAALLEHCGYSLETYVVDWREMRDVQRAYLESGLANQDVPQDHVFFAVLFQKAAEMGIRYWLSGSNLVSESILPRSWGYTAMDSRQLLAVHKRFGQVPLRSYKTLNFFEYCRFYSDLPFVSTVSAVAPLNLMPYKLGEARETLARETGWRDYGRKHSESLFTKFFQNYYLPHKFGYDKRKAHLSSLIAAGDLSRDEALDRLREPLYDEASLRGDRDLLLEKLGYSPEEWERIMAVPNASYQEYPNWQTFIGAGKAVKRRLRATGLLR